MALVLNIVGPQRLLLLHFEEGPSTRQLPTERVDLDVGSIAGEAELELPRAEAHPIDADAVEVAVLVAGLLILAHVFEAAGADEEPIEAGDGGDNLIGLLTNEHVG